jgi:hypothetical protein
VLARTLSTPRTRKLPASFFLAVLQAFEKIGDSQMLPAVTWLAHGKGVARDCPPLQAAAQACVTHLQEQLHRRQAPYLLLRPSSLAEASNSLLRPIATSLDAAPHELLRANNTPYGSETTSSRDPVAAVSELVPIRLRQHEIS